MACHIKRYYFGSLKTGFALLVGPSLLLSLPARESSAGDGDCGSTVKRGAVTILQALKEERVPLNDAAALCRCLARCCSAMGGTSGAVYNILLTAVAG